MADHTLYGPTRRLRAPSAFQLLTALKATFEHLGEQCDVASTLNLAIDCLASLGVIRLANSEGG